MFFWRQNLKSKKIVFQNFKKKVGTIWRMATIDKLNNEVTLANGIRMPLFGLGTYEMESSNVEKTLKTALKQSNYTMVDTAAIYHNEKAIGDTLKSLKFPRDSLFLTTKLSPYNQGKEKCHKALQESLSNLQVDFLDLYLIHWPGTSKLQRDDPKNLQNR